MNPCPPIRGLPAGATPPSGAAVLPEGDTSNTLVREGLMLLRGANTKKSDSPYGVWEISDEGRRWLMSQGN